MNRIWFWLPDNPRRFFWNNRRALCLILIVGMLASVYHLSSTWNLLYLESTHLLYLSSTWKTDGPDGQQGHLSSKALSCPIEAIASDHLRYKKPSALGGRTDVVAVTPWLAPIVWESTFEPVLLDAIYKPCNITVATTVFAVGKYIRFLKDFLETAESHFFVGFRVHYYVFTDRRDEVPSVKLAAGRELFVRPAPNLEPAGAGRFKHIANFIKTDLRDGADYVFCFDVNSKFHGHWGTETLGKLVAVLAPNYYFRERSEFIYERRPASKAFMSADEGDFYYAAGAFGGEPASVHHMLWTCNDNFELDARQGIEAAWQEESHYNDYLWLHKPTKVLSPEYQWHDLRPPKPNIKIIRFSRTSDTNL